MRQTLEGSLIGAVRSRFNAILDIIVDHFSDETEKDEEKLKKAVEKIFNKFPLHRKRLNRTPRNANASYAA